jgi:predicted Zn finger-like uncharacterized protein
VIGLESQAGNHRLTPLSEYGSVTQCPHCKTSFHVGPIQLEAANGHVRCGGCLKVFDAHEHFLVEQKPLFGGIIEGPLESNPLESEEELEIIPEKLNSESESEQAPSQPEQELEQIEQEEMEAILLGYDEPQHDSDEQEANDGIDAFAEAFEESPEKNKAEVQDQTSEPAFQNLVEADEFFGPEPSQDPIENTDGEINEDKEIESMLDQAFDELEEDLAGTDEDGTDTEDDWQPMVPERTGAAAAEPVLSQQANINEDEELAEQLFVGASKRRAYKKISVPWVIGTTFLFVILFVQTLYWQPSTLRHINFYNQVSLNYCALLPCRELVLQDLSQLYVTGLVRPSTQYNNALSVQVELRNRADLAQRFPHIELAFTDLRGQKISLRRFSPEEYLRAETAGRTELGPFQRIQIEMELYDPGASAISYEFNLLYIN